MTHTSEYADWNHIQDLSAQSLLEAFLGFVIPGEVPQGIRQINLRYAAHFAVFVYLSVR